MNKYTVILFDSRVLVGKFHGSGGVCKTHGRVKQVMLQRLKEETKPRLGILPEHQGNVTVWTDPDNADCSKQGTTVKASEIQEIRHPDGVIWAR